ncbi:MAG: PLP-dependent cysteine synthase family protein [SAR324 cluster bacterium]|nr:PLP-dependent cysteine synthase family protein [SAR324 cluster bacterium]MCZ6841760.1 PLP-dependent cysteine synthase family protein [SAR324 cluster bacterium]
MKSTAAKAKTAPDRDLGSSVTDLIGNTPLLRLSRVCPQANLYAKAEWYNPGQSCKDRPALYILNEAERSGQLKKGLTVLDATSGNTGIAYAMICADRGYPVTLCMPASVTPARIKVLKAYGAELILTDPTLFSDGAILKARELYAAAPEKYFYADQYGNENNWISHYETTGPEIYAQTAGRITHFVATLGTGGTFTGAGRFLKEQSKDIQLIEVQPDAAFHGLEGMKHMESSIVPPIYDAMLADRKMAVRTEAAYRWVVELAKREGLLAGISSGAALEAARIVAAENPQGTVVTVFPDNGLKYLSEHFWDDNL